MSSCSGKDHDRATDLASSFTAGLITIATGALVLSIGLVASADAYGPKARYCLLASWILLTLSILAGLTAQSTIAMHEVHGVSIFESPRFEWPSRIQQVSFFISIFVLAIVLIAQLFSTHSVAEEQVGEPGKAIALLRSCIRDLDTVNILSIDLIHGRDPANDTWHLRFAPVESGKVTDVLIGVDQGDILDVQEPARVQCPSSASAPKRGWGLFLKW